MILEDIVYFASLVMCIAVGKYFKSIEDVEMKKCYGAGMGLLIMCLVCRQYFLHSFLMVLGNIAIIKCCDKRYMHQICLAYTWVYLMYLGYNLDVSRYITIIYQGLALRLVGLAFELRTLDKSRLSLTRRASALPKGTSTTKIVSQQDVSSLLTINGPDPSPLEILTYSYFFVGIHKGPYYKLNCFNEYFELPISSLGDWREITKENLKKVALCTLGYVLLSMKFPLWEYESEDFYNKCGSDYRFFYNVPQLLIFCLHHQIIMTLCTCVFTETGFGIYPSRWNTLPGIGPSTRASSSKLNVKSNENESTPPVTTPPEQEYNFSMLKCYDNEMLFEGPMMKNSMRGWDMPTQYWFWAYIYKSLLKANKEVRSACSFFVWSIWLGPTMAHVLFSITLWIYIHLENEYDTLYNTRQSMRYTWNFGYSVMRLLFLIYLTPCLVLDNSQTVFKYYTSVYWSFHVILFGLVISAVGVYKVRGAPAHVNN